MAKSRLKASYDFGQALIKSGVLTEEQLNLTERVVIDIQANNGVRIYLQQFGEDGKMARDQAGRGG